MNTREIVDAINIDTKEKVYFKGHAKATYMSNGKSIEDALNDGDFLTREVAEREFQPIGDYAEEVDLAGKSDKIPVVDHGTGETTFVLTPNVYHKWGTITALSLTLEAVSDATVYNEYMFEFVSGTTATTLSLPDTISWVSEPSVEAGKTYQCSIVNNIGVIAAVDN